MIAEVSPLQSRVPAAAEPPASSVLCVGALVRYRDQVWVITADHSHPRWGRFFRLERPIEGAYDLVHANGNDGALEALDSAL